MSDAVVWFVIVALGAATYLVRWSFLGLIGDRPLPPWLLRHLRYTGVAVIPGLVAPLVLWPASTGGAVDPWRLLAAAATLGVAAWRKDVLQAVAAGAVVLGAAALLS
ncbi:AzlD domain-containing protein [Jannaschia sp. W003]|uniref:AzlD domain-containing protein n=1 Tax=Jannaschia sp. W003 TaxID=2867012 RepID=UPI0021A44DA4|nr:AzlD domain-containing protein [Jannaschia sp. W003]UWQ21414.1 AzlD domain-containing protein [Jannaschia sp. W003]